MVDLRLYFVLFCFDTTTRTINNNMTSFHFLLWTLNCFDWLKIMKTSLLTLFFKISNFSIFYIYLSLAWTSIKLLLTYLNFDLSLRLLLVLQSKSDTIDGKALVISFVDPCSYWWLTTLGVFRLTILYLERWNLSNAGSYFIAK